MTSVLRRELDRRAFLKLMGGVMAAPLAVPPDRPNVLLVISDQLYYAASGVAGNPIIKTPNIDRLAREGARFAHALCPTPFCSPSRASMLTGLYPHKHGITYNVQDPARGLDPGLPSALNTLAAAGYTCRQRGKWHLGDKTRIPAYADDPELDYDAYLQKAMNTPEGGGGRRKRRAGGVDTIELVKKALAQYDGERGINIGRSHVPIEHTHESWIADTAISQLEALSGKPFFMTVSFPAPHAPWIVNEPYYSMYERSRIPLPANRHAVEEIDRGTPSWRFGQLLGDEGFREYLGVYYGMVSMVDWNLGRVFEALARLKRDANTLVILTADHGDMQGGHGMYGKMNFSIYEETTRIPMLMRFPGKIPASRVVRTQAGLCDVEPTILDYLGARAPEKIHGRSLRPFLDGKEELDRPIFCERERGMQHFQRTIRTLTWKYCYSSSGASQLHNLEKDPGETRNLIADASGAGIRQELHAKLARWMGETEDPRLKQMPPRA